MACLRFKKRADLLQYAARHPGALATQFLLACREKLSQRAARGTSDLFDLDLTKWGRDLTGLKDIRDQREAQTLAQILQHLLQDRLEEAADTIAQRVKAILMAKSEKGSWAKATQVELLPIDGTSVALPSEIALAGLPC